MASAAAPPPLSSPESDPRLVEAFVPFLEKLVKNASWRNKAHSKLSHTAKSILDRLQRPPPPSPATPATPTSPSTPTSSSWQPGPLRSLSLEDSELLLSPIASALGSGSAKLAEAALELLHRLIAHSYIHGEADPSADPSAQLVATLLDAACNALHLDDEHIELLLLKTLLSAVTSTSVRLHGDCLLRAVRACYDMYLGSRSTVNQATAKASLVQMLVIVFRRMEADSSTIPVQPIVVAEVIELPEAPSGGSPTADANFVQGFISKIIGDIDGALTPLARTTSSAGAGTAVPHDGAFETTAAAEEGANPADLLDSTDKDMLDAKYWEISMYKTALEGRKDELGVEGAVVATLDDDADVRIGNKLRRDAFLVFRALCKLSMKTPPKDAPSDPIVMRGKILALELLKILLENAGAVFRTSDRFLGAIKQYLCLSLLKNCASSHMIVFQLSCSIFISLVARFRPGLKAEIGVFFPMIILRVLESIAQPNFQAKMIVLRFLEKLCGDSQILVDIFINYDCDVHSSNIFERMVNGLLKTAQGPPAGIPTTLVPPQDTTMKSEAMKCLVSILRSMGDWMNKQLRIPDLDSPKVESEQNDNDGGNEFPQTENNGDASSEVSDSHSELSNGVSEAASLEQRRAYKMELQEGISLFNRKPRKGIEFLINANKVGESAEEIAAFLKTASGLNKTMIAMSMKTQRDAFITSLAKFTSLHSAADIKQKNIEAIKAIMLIAEEDGNYLQEAWEHILTCVSRYENLHLVGEGAPSDATFFALQQPDLDKSKQAKSSIIPSLKKKALNAGAASKRGTYDSAGVGGKASGVDQMNNSVAILLEQVGMAEMNRVFIRSQNLNSEGIIDFVKAICKVSMEELRSASDPRVFSLTKIVEITHYNMNRIRLVWSSIWHVLSEFFVTIGCSENLSIAIFAMDSLRQLAMKFLEREELANYNFQNEFMKPFVVVMRKSRAVEIRELIIRCVSQMVLARVSHVKSGWKSMFMVFATASYDDHKNIVLLAFEIIEKILRDYFPYITETESSTFTDCVNCLIAFTNSRFNKDISLNAIGFLRFCAAKLAEGDIGSSSRLKESPSSNSSALSPHLTKDRKQEGAVHVDKDDTIHFWFPLLAGLSELTFDLRPEIRKSSLQVLFDTLRNHGHLFSLPLWEKVFDSVLFPIFDYVRHAIDPSGGSSQGQNAESDPAELDHDAWMYETCTLALQLVVDLFVKFYDTVNPLLKKVLSLLTSFIKRPHQSLAGIGIAAFVRLMSSAGSVFVDEKWLEVVLSLKEATTETLPDFSYISSGAYLENVSIENGDSSDNREEEPRPSEDGTEETSRSRNLYFAIADAKCRAAVQLLLIQAVMEIYNMYRAQLSSQNTVILFEALHTVATHAHKINSDNDLRTKLQELGSMTQMQDPPLLRLENESYQLCLTVLQNIFLDRAPDEGSVEVEKHLVSICKEVLEVYLSTARPAHLSGGIQPLGHWLIPVGSSRRRELAARAPLVVSTLQAISGLGDSSFEKNLGQFFPLLADLISCEHGSGEVQVALSDMFSTWVGPLVLQSC
uniref:Uncharacterized protein n=1 Tax=Avena sativa TaxID=4498 RepID=A0ACD5TW08_AVESA